MKCGKVYLVGAGPGPSELLTLKASNLLRSADVVVYDRLVQEDVLKLAPPSAERIYMGKKVGENESRQGEIHRLLLEKARAGKVVVRLKGGDPFLFGRGGEEVEFLAKHAIPFDIVPGVSAAFSAPLRAGIPVTYRGLSASVAIVTGHESDEETSRLPWDALGQIDTLIVLMGIRNIESLCRKLVEHGRSSETPAAVIQMAFWPGERIVTGTLADIAGRIARAGIQPPATLVIGETVRLRQSIGSAHGDRLDGVNGND